MGQNIRSNVPGERDVLDLESGLEAFRSSPTFRGPVEPLDGHDSNEHLALIHETREEQFAAVVPFLRQGLARGERCLYVVDETTREEVVAALRAGGVDVDAALDSGALTFHTAEDTYLRNGTFEPDEMVEFYADAIEEATEEYEALRVAAETAWILDEATDLEEFMAYESEVNHLFEGEDCIALCQYDRTLLPPEIIEDIVRTHPHLVYDGTVSHNVYYTPPEEFFGPEQPASEVDRMLNTLVDRTVTKAALRSREEFLRKIYGVTSSADTDFEEKLDALFELGCEFFDLDHGGLAQVDPSTDRFEVEVVSGEHEHLAPGEQCSLSETYCRTVTDDGETVAVTDPVAAGFEDELCYDQFGVRAYVGTYLELEADVDRTFWFVSNEPHDRAITDEERTFLELMGQWVKYELERHQRERELRERKQRQSALVETTPECIKTVAADGTLLQMNSAGLDMVEADSESDVIGECVYDLIAPEDRETFREFNERICRGESGTMEFDIVGLEGSRRHMETHAAPLSRPDGTTAHVALTRDVTEQVERERYQRELYEVTADGDRSFEEKLEGVLELGCERFGLDLGAMARVDPEADRFEVEHVSDDHEYLEPGFELPLSETYCTAATDAGAAASVSDPIESGYDDIHVYGEFGIRAYLGTYVEVDGGPDRTFFFVSQEAREEPFSDEERTFLDLMGQWVSYELGRRQRERYQRELYEVTSRTDAGFDEKLQAVLDLGCERFGLDLGGIARVDPETDLFEVEAINGEHEHLVPGARVALSETYCRVLADRGTTDGVSEVVEVSDPEGAGFADAACYDEFGVETYLGTRIEVDGGPDRTFFFVSTGRRDEPFSDEDQTFHRLMGQWVSYELERRQRENRLSALNALARELMDEETAVEMSESIVAAAEGTLDLPVAAIALYDERDGVLEPAARTDAAADLLEATSLLDVGEAGWQAFVEGDTRRVADPVGDGADRPSVTEAAVLPLGNHGVLLAGSTATGGLGPTDLDFAETVAANARAAFDRADRERQLQDREAALETQNETLERLNRVNDIIRSIDRALVQASTRSEIYAVVCEKLAESGPYELAWIGEHDSVTDEITPREWAGAESGYLDEITVTVDDEPEGQGPAGRAVRTGEPQVVNDILEDPSFQPWRQAALNRGYHASVTLPLVYEDSLYGVLNVYADRPDVFHDLERSVLAELSDTIAYAVNAVESKKALVSDEVTELEFEIGAADLPVAAVADELDCEMALENVASQSDGGLRLFFSTRGVTASTLRDSARRLPVEDLTLVSEHEEGGEPVCLFDARPADGSICATVVEHGGVPRSLTATGGTATLLAEFGADRDVRGVVSMFRSRYPSAELVAHRSRERSRRTPTEFRAALTDELTDRQLEVLRIAYFSGYFETPRTRTGSEVATSLDIAQPTFNTHVRAAHRKLCGLLFENEAALDATDGRS